MDGIDPGWPSLRAVAMAVALPWQSQRVVDRAGNALLGLRAVYLSFVTSVIAFGVVLLFLTGSKRRSLDPAIVAVAIGVVGVACVLVARLRDRPLNCSTDETLASSYRTRFFFRMALAQAPSLAGFVGFFVGGGELWAYALGCAFAAVGFVYAAPTAAQIARDQTTLGQTGCRRSLLLAFG